MSQLQFPSKLPVLTPGDVVLNVNLMIEGFRACNFPKNDGKVRAKDARYILSFLRLIESAVLHEKLWSDNLSPKNSTLKYQDPQSAGILGGGFGILWDTLNKEGVYQSYSGIASLTDLDAYKSRLSFYEKSYPTEITFDERYWLEAITFSETSRVQFLPDTRDLAVFPKFISSHNGKVYKSLISQANNSLNKSIKAQVEKLNSLASTEEITIPPITAVILNKASKLSDVPEILLEIRHKFSKVREAFRLYETTLSDPNLTIRRRMRAVNDIQFISQELSKTYDYVDELRIQEWPDLWSAFSEIANEGLTTEAIVKYFIGKPLENLVNYIRLRNVQYLFTVKRKALSTSSQLQMLRRLFGDIDEQYIIEVLKASGLAT